MKLFATFFLLTLTLLLVGCDNLFVEAEQTILVVNKGESDDLPFYVSMIKGNDVVRVTGDIYPGQQGEVVECTKKMLSNRDECTMTATAIGLVRGNSVQIKTFRLHDGRFDEDVWSLSFRRVEEKK